MNSNDTKHLKLFVHCNFCGKTTSRRNVLFLSYKQNTQIFGKPWRNFGKIFGNIQKCFWKKF